MRNAYKYAFINTAIATLMMLLLGQTNEYLGKYVLPLGFYVLVSPLVAFIGVILGLYQIKHHSQNDILMILITINMIYALSFFALSGEILWYIFF